MYVSVPTYKFHVGLPHGDTMSQIKATFTTEHLQRCLPDLKWPASSQFDGAVMVYQFLRSDRCTSSYIINLRRIAGFREGSRHVPNKAADSGGDITSAHGDG